MKLFSLLFLTLFSLGAFAMDEQGFSAKLYDILESKQYKITELEPGSLTSQQVSKLLNAANEETEIWADTILEGNYVLATGSKVELVGVEKVLSPSAEFLAYRIVFQQAAYDLNNCDVDWDLADRDPKAFDAAIAENCGYGHIVGAAFVSPDFKYHFRDYNAIEEFQD